MCSFNELEYAWVAKETWAFERSFELSAATLACESVVFSFTGLDTAAMVFLNDGLMCEAGNAFRWLELQLHRQLSSIVHSTDENGKLIMC